MPFLKTMSWIAIVGACLGGSAASIAQQPPSDSSAVNPVEHQSHSPSSQSDQEPPQRIRPEDVPEDVPRALGPGAGAIPASQRVVRSEGAADEGSDLVLRTPDGIERMRITAAGRVGIGTATPSSTLHVTGAAVFGKQIVAMPWTNVGAPPPGYVKLVTPIVHTESNMFQIRISGYRYFPVGDSFEIRCSGYAYAGNYLIRTTCQTDGTDLPVEIGAETRPGGTDPVVVVRIGTPTTAWYYAHFSAEYDGWVAKSPNGFQWVVGETTPAQTGNLNNIVADDNTGTLTVGAVGTAPTANRLVVNGASAFKGNVAVGVEGTPTQDSFVSMGGNATTGPVFNLGYSGASFGRSSAFFNVRPDASAVAPNPSLRFLTANVQRMIITNTGQVGIGTVTPAAGMTLDVAGNANFSGTVTGGNIQAKYQDLAEWVPARHDLAPGTVVVLDTGIGNGVMASSAAYDLTVAGVVSLQPGILLGEAGASKEQIATTGRVRVLVDATTAPIRAGDLLVTSATPGRAMRSEPVQINGRPFHQPGTIIGKALEPLATGEGEILVLLSLQ